MLSLMAASSALVEPSPSKSSSLPHVPQNCILVAMPRVCNEQGRGREERERERERKEEEEEGEEGGEEGEEGGGGGE